MKSLLRLRSYFRPYWGLVTIAYLAVVFNAGTTLIVPQLIGSAVDQGIVQENVAALVRYGVLIMLVSAVRGLAAFCQGYQGESAAQGVSYGLRRALYSHVQSLSFSFHDQAQTGELMARATSDVEALRNFTGRGLLQIVNLVLLLVGVTIALLRMNWELAALSVVILPLLVWRTNRFSRRIRPMYRKLQDQVARVAGMIQENVSGVRVVKAFGREREEMERFEQGNDQLYEDYLDAAKEQAVNAPFIEFLSNGSMLGLLWFTGWLVIGKHMSQGELVAFYAYLLQLVAPIRRGGWLMAMGSRAAASSERVFEILDTPITVANKPGAIELPDIQGRVEFQDVSCAYHPGRPVLQGVSFVAEPGMMIALVGATGSGKTTVANLIPRFYDVSDGRVLIDGHDVRDVDLHSLRRQIGIVMQETMLFSGTIRENLAFGRPDATDQEIEDAVRAARALEFIERLPQGYDTIVGERGVSLSGGQKQRVAIARALVLDPRLLILDEFTSSVDVATERLIRAALQELMKGRTSFVIAHRLSTVRMADMILVLDKGRIVGAGRHEELLASNEVYREINASQLVETPVEGDGKEPSPAAAGEGTPDAALSLALSQGERER
ncbi:MAG TPA: ABC transporter ATP-binding protein [Chloroflexota bacterium]|nr:ABC transporter ATP-binding protein [Chloroflexota bacterium]